MDSLHAPTHRAVRHRPLPATVAMEALFDRFLARRHRGAHRYTKVGA
jgi:hypothetical protein